MKFRIYGIDTPERGWRAKCESEKLLEEEAREFLINWFKSGKSIDADIKGFDKYGGRYLADIRIDGEDIATKLKELNYAVEYFGKGKKHSWCI